ncbi:MAG: Ppx/GppA family phosphatase, partial [Polyangiaceae bacterium]
MAEPRTERPTGVGEEPEFAAAIDLGSNSFHMIVGRLEAGKLTIVDKLRDRVRLAAGLDEAGNIAPDAQERAIACLQRFGQRLGGMPRTSVRAVGTNTLRKAKNSRGFMAEAQTALGYPIETISGREEARLIYLGVAQTTPDQGRRLVVDIGGGSTEAIIGEGFDILEADSLYMGCVSFSERYFSGEITSRAFRDAQLAAELELQSITHRYRELGWERAVGCSGTMHAVYSIIRENGWAESITLK